MFFEAEVRIKDSIFYLYNVRYLKETNGGVSQMIIDLRYEIWDEYIKLKVVGIWLVL